MSIKKRVDRARVEPSFWEKKYDLLMEENRILEEKLAEYKDLYDAEYRQRKDYVAVAIKAERDRIERVARLHLPFYAHRELVAYVLNPKDSP